MMIEARILALDGIRHGFFTRAGGVSGGLYASLNGGVGSNDNTAHVTENRARMAAARLTETGAQGMGELFKALAIADPKLGPLPGFETSP